MIYPPSEDTTFRDTKKNLSFKGLAPPLGLLYIAKLLENNGNKVTIIDFTAEDFDLLKLKTELKKTDIICMTVLSFSLNNSIRIINFIKKIKPQIKIIIGGPHCNLFPKKALEETGADISVQGDGESVILDIIKAINNKADFSKIKGIYYREKNTIKKGKKLELITNIDTISFPARNLIKKYNYGKEYFPKISKGEFSTIITSRGCPFSCKFCSRNSISMKKYRCRSVENIIKELKELKKNGYKYIAFEDDSFLFNKKQVNELFDNIIKEKINLKFIITAVRVDSVDKELFEKMKKAGVTHIQFGLESGSQEILDFYNKKTTIEIIRNAVTLSHNFGFFTIGTFIIGAPFETKNYIKKTVYFAKKLPLDSVTFLPLKYVAGSELWCNAVNNKKISEDEYLVYADSERGLGLFTYEEIYNICIKAQLIYYIRLSFILRLFIKSLKNDDLSFLQSYISFFYSYLKNSLKLFLYKSKLKEL